MKICENGTMRELTFDEIAAMEAEAAKFAAQERTRPMTAEEVTSMLIKQQINTLEVDDKTALRMTEFYPEWKSGLSVSVGYKVQYNGNLYKVITAHTTQADWTPDTAVTLFERIDETHDGSKYDPIPYEWNMVLENGKYYTQDGVTYICTRDTGNPVYHALKDLIGLYVDVTE